MLLLESAKDKGPFFAPGDRVIPNEEMLSIHVMKGNVQELKEILISLKREIDSCMHKTELG